MQQMSKSEFLAALADALYSYSDLSDEVIERQIRQFERYFSRMSEEEAKAAIADFDNVDAIAANIYALIKDRERRGAGLREQHAQRVRDYDHTAPHYTVVDSSAEPVATAVYDKVSQKHERDIEPSDVDAGATIKIDRVDNVRPIEEIDGNSAGRAVDQTDGLEPEGSLGDIESYADTHLDFSSLDEVPTQTSPMFWVLFALTFPIWGSIALSVLSLFLLCFGALAVLIVALVALMISVAAAGTGLSLFGIIYGITQTFTVLPAGLFEIGLGVTIGGAAMFVGISVYNIAIRFLPFVMRKLFEFLKFVLRSSVRLFLKIKRECAVQ